jgi:methylated-DNA-[protein]-cysteine S-methyltransferase
MRKSAAPETLSLDRLESPVGTLLVVHDRGHRLRALDFADHETRMRRLLRLHYGRESVDFVLDAGAAPDLTRRALADYFAGELSAIDAVDVMTAGTPFQRAVWRALRTIRPGSTWSYGALARQIGRPRAVRAVGLANGANPIGIVVPCHRVIGSDASLTGYGGGVARKRWLLHHEGIAFATTSMERDARVA